MNLPACSFSSAPGPSSGGSGGRFADAVVPPHLDGRLAPSFGEVEADRRRLREDVRAGLIAVHGLDGVRQSEIQEPMSRVQDVRPPVAEGAVAVVEPPAPGQRVQFRAVGAHGPCGVPEIPVEAGRHRLAGGEAIHGPAVPSALAVHEHDDLRHVGDDAGLGPGFELEVVVPRMALVAHLGDQARAGRHGDEAFDFAKRLRERLLDVDVLAPRERVHRQREVRVVRRGDDDGVDRVPGLLQHGPQVAETRGGGEELPRLACVLSVEIDVAQRGDRRPVRRGEGLQHVEAAVADAGEREAERAVRRCERGRTLRGQHRRQRRPYGKGRGRAERRRDEAAPGDGAAALWRSICSHVTGLHALGARTTRARLGRPYHTASELRASGERPCT